MNSTPMSKLVAQFADQAEDLELHRHVQRRRRLVRDQDLGPAGQRDGDHHALPHAARQLVRIGVELQTRIGDADHLQQFLRPRPRGAAGGAVVHPDRLADLLADLQHRVERRHRLLEDHRDAAKTAFDPQVWRQAA